MNKVIIPGTDLLVSRFVFGTASLHHLGPIHMQVAHLAAAADAGFTHFDTAPLYGFGCAENALGAAFADDMAITITTKIGLYPPISGDPSRLGMMARKIAGKVWPSLSRAVVDFSVERARRSLEASLRRLRRDRLELLLLHEPLPDLLLTDEWQRWRESEADRVRNFGIAGPGRIVTPFLQMDGPLTSVIQVRDGLDTRESDVVTEAGRPLQLTYGYFTSATCRRSGAEILRAALARNPQGAILVSTRNQARLGQFAAAASVEPAVRC